MNARTIAGVERERESETHRESCISKKQKNRIVQQPDTHTHTLWSLENERGISFYALLKLYIRDG